MWHCLRDLSGYVLKNWLITSTADNTCSNQLTMNIDCSADLNLVGQPRQQITMLVTKTSPMSICNLYKHNISVMTTKMWSNSSKTIYIQSHVTSNLGDVTWLPLRANITHKAVTCETNEIPSATLRQSLSLQAEDESPLRVSLTNL